MSGRPTRTVKKRFNEHAKANSLIGRAIHKHGAENFRYGIIKNCATKEELDYWEKFFIAELRCKTPNGYNLTDGGDGFVDLKRTPEHCAKISMALKRNKNSFGSHRTKEFCVNLSASRIGENNPFYGKHHTPEHCAKMLVMFNGENNPFYGRHHTTDSLAKMSAAHLGQKPSNYGKHHTVDSLAKMSAVKRNETPYKNLIAEMDARQLTYTVLAKLLDLSRAAVSYKMLDKRKFTDSDKIKLVEIFGKPIEYLLARDDD